jgi:hypothetical protein
MAEAQIDPFEAGRRIAREYLSKRGWARERRRALNTQLYPAFDRETLEEKERECDQMEQLAEEYLSSEYERLRHDASPEARETIRGIYQSMGVRNDLGFFAKKIIEHARREFGF